MGDTVINAIVLIQNWGDDREIINVMKDDRHIISIFHIMGRYSYLIDVNFDSREQLSDWINLMKTVKLPGGVPAMLSLNTQRVIDVHKQKSDFTLEDYNKMKKEHHFFVEIDNPHHDEEILSLIKESPIVYSVLHVQGETSYTVEVIVKDYDEYRKFLAGLKKVSTLHHVETFEVISVLKYRNSIRDEGGNLRPLADDHRELYTL
jgi:hypothetical protein